MIMAMEVRMIIILRGGSCTNEHEDEPTIDDVDFHEHSNASNRMDVCVDLDIQNVDIQVNSLARVDLIEDGIKT